jgi:hypothetical protein
MNEYLSNIIWNRKRPRTLVVACSDGRLQEQVDEFLQNNLAIVHYDRLYLPGGPGALAASGFDMLRANQHQKEFEFVIVAHDTEEVILLFHGPSENGPPEASCADYIRKLPRATPQEIRRQQEEDAKDIIRSGWIRRLAVQLHFYRCEVRGDSLIQVVQLNV